MPSAPCTPSIHHGESFPTVNRNISHRENHKGRNSQKQPSATHKKRNTFEYELNIDVQKTSESPFIQTFGKSLFRATWIQARRQNEELVLLHITGDRAEKEALLNIQLPFHPHIVRTFGLVKHNGEGILLLQEYARHGSLLNLLHAERHLPSSEVVHNITLQILDGLIFLTEHGIIHADLACRNVLVFKYHSNEPSNNLVKLTDFGISRRSNTATSLDIIALLSSAPEVLRFSQYSEKSDVWAFAVLAWEIYSKGTTPVIRAGSRDYTENNRLMFEGERLPRPPTCPSVRWNLFLQCMRENPDDRPTFRLLQQQLLRS